MSCGLPNRHHRGRFVLCTRHEDEFEYSVDTQARLIIICLGLEVVHNLNLRRRNRRVSGWFELRPGGCRRPWY